MPGTNHTLCFSGTGPKSWGQFAADIASLRGQISHATHICNLLSDRYHFMIGLAAAMLNGQITVLPAAAAPGAIRAALADADRPLILGGEPKHHGTFENQTVISENDQGLDPADMLSALRVSTTPIHVYTSGTTKTPERRVKDWKTLFGGAAVAEEILERLGATPDTTALLGTTPHQHMYGLEATIFVSLGFGRSLHRSTVFFPADIETAIADARACGFKKAVLVTSPAHLRFLEATLLETKEICGVISATAPLSLAQAERLEARGNLAVMEIYGSTETGSLAIRRTNDGNLWEPVAGFELEDTSDGSLASAPHLAERCLLGDTVELLGDGKFRLLGRTGDMVGIAGKRANLSALNAILVETPCLLDGVVLRQPGDGGQDDQLAIVAVINPESGLSAAEAKSDIRAQFRDHVDPVFLPRRVAFADRLPRTPTGKIDVSGTEELLRILSA